MIIYDVITTQCKDVLQVTTVQVRYIVHDVDAAIAFYTQRLGFNLEMHPAPAFAMLSRGDLRLVLSAPNPAGGGGQPLQLHPADSIPRFAWGKRFEDGNYLKMPLSVQGHHALMDGIHMGEFYAEVQGYLHQPEVGLGGV
jgi:catechol 2,3-dioxygenase-like lactoylglutathione lyase family enzyme